jgi:thiol-disulfide isomerase/thioredoxin
MNTTGLLVAVLVLVLATGVGLWRRRTDGRLRPVGGAGSGPIASGPEGSGPMGSGSAGSTAVGSGSDVVGSGSDVVGSGWDRAVPSAGDRPPVSATAPSDPAGSGSELDLPAGTSSPDRGAAGERIDPALLAELGVQPAQATLLQFSSAFCAPCRAVRRISGEVADMIPGVQHVEVDAESHLEAVRTLGIWRTPTLLVLDADGRVVRRATGVPGKPQLIAVLGDILPTR